ncbi:MAG: hypothetical protein IBX63_02065, partial [Coriobacteriia bacterium]|nr:hypothetical protein [Coriobacteriia bacterium]
MSALGALAGGLFTPSVAHAADRPGPDDAEYTAEAIAVPDRLATAVHRSPNTRAGFLERAVIAALAVMPPLALARVAARAERFLAAMRDETVPSLVLSSSMTLQGEAFAVQTASETLPSQQVSGTISSDTTWTADTVWVVSGNVTVASGAHLTLEPGTVVKFAGASSRLTVDGTLTAVGTPAERITFTSIRDDTAGGDTNGDGDATQPAKGDWDKVRFGPGASASRLEHAEVRYGGASSGYNTPYASVVVDGSSPAIRHATVTAGHTTGVYVIGAGAAPSIRDSVVSGHSTGVYYSGAAGELRDCVVEGNSTGVNASGGSPALIGNVLSGNTLWPLVLDPNTAPAMSGNTGTGNGTDGIRLSGTRSSATPYTLVRQPLPYVVSGIYTVGASATLTLEPGTVVKFAGASSRLTVDGTLTAVGTPAERITFTSIRDDTAGGDTNGDGDATQPAKGDWDKVRFGPGASASRLEHAEVRYGGASSGYNTPYASVVVDGSSPAIRHATVTAGHTTGVYVIGAGAAPSIRDSVVSGHSTGVYYSGAAGELRDCVVEGNSTGVNASSATPAITRSTIRSNSYRGVDIAGTAVPTLNYCNLYGNPNGNVRNNASVIADVRRNYWGTHAGPSVSDRLNTVYDPWSTVSVKDGKTAAAYGSNSPSPAGGDPVNTATGNYFLHTTDIAVPGLGPDLALARDYSSQDAATNNGPFGRGWSHSFGISLRFDPDDEVTVVYGDGRRMTFEPLVGGAYASPDGILEELRQTAGGYELAHTDLSVLSFNENGRPVSHADRHGNALSFHYTGDLLTSITAPGGRELVFEYASNRIVRLSDQAGREVTYAYSAAGDLVEVTDLRGGTTAYTYDAGGQMTAIHTPGSGQTPWLQNTYDAEGRVTDQLDVFGSEFAYDYDAEGRVTTLNNYRGLTETHAFDSLFRATDMTDGGGNTTARTYNDRGLIASLTDARNHTTLFVYDTAGNRTRMTDPLGHERRAAYDAETNDILWSEDEAGTRTTYTYDEAKRFLERIATPLSAIDFEHYETGLVKSTTLAG